MSNLSCHYNPSYLDPFFEAFFGTPGTNENFGTLAMKTDITEEEKFYVLSVDLPGFKKENIELSFKDGYLTIAVEMKGVDEKTKFLRRERFMGKASRRYYVGDIDETLVEARFEDGVLTVRVPKELKEEKTHQIKIS